MIKNEIRININNDMIDLFYYRFEIFKIRKIILLPYMFDFFFIY